MDPLDIAAVLKHYGADDVPEGGWRSMRCPFQTVPRRQAREWPGKY